MLDLFLVKVDVDEVESLDVFSLLTLSSEIGRNPHSHLLELWTCVLRSPHSYRYTSLILARILD